MDLAKLYSDKATYPDEMTIELGGEKMSLKEWRDGLGLKSEFTKHTQELSGKARQQEQVLQEMQRREQLLQGQLAQAMQARGVNPNNAQDDDLAAYRTDPAFGPVVKLIEQQKAVIAQLAQRQQMDEIAVNSWRYQGQLERLKEKDADLDPQALAKFTHEFYGKGPDVEAAYRLFTEEKRMKKAVEDAEKRGYEKAKTEPPVPPQPGGRRGGAAQEKALPADWESRKSMALQEFGGDIAEALQNQ